MHLEGVSPRGASVQEGCGMIKPVQMVGGGSASRRPGTNDITDVAEIFYSPPTAFLEALCI